VLLALRRDDASSWSLAVCTASDGAEYHPQYPVPLRSEANFDPCLFLRGIANEKVLDSAVWARLSNPNPNPNPTRVILTLTLTLILPLTLIRCGRCSTARSLRRSGTRPLILTLILTLNLTLTQPLT